MAYFIEYMNEAVNLDLVEDIKFKGDFHANEYSITFKLPSGEKTWDMGEVAFNKIKDLIRETTKKDK